MGSELKITTIKDYFRWLNVLGIAVKSLVSRFTIKCYKHLRSIIIYFSDMVNGFFGLKISFNFFFDYKSMFKNIIVVIFKRVSGGMYHNVSSTFACTTVPHRMMFPFPCPITLDTFVTFIFICRYNIATFYTLWFSALPINTLFAHISFFKTTRIRFHNTFRSLVPRGFTKASLTHFFDNFRTCFFSPLIPRSLSFLKYHNILLKIKRASFSVAYKKRLNFHTLTKSPVFDIKKPILVSSLIIACLFLNVKFCEAQQEERFYSILTFDKLLNSHSSPWVLTDNQASEVRNVRANREYGSVSKRATMLALMDGSASIIGLHRYYKANTIQRTINAESTFLYDVSSAGVQTLLASGLSDGAWWSFITYQDIAIGMNGTDKAIKWDGSLSVTDNTDAHRTAGNLVAELGAPFAELNTGSNLTASKWYQYKMAHYDGSSYTYSTARSNPIKTGSTVRDIYLTDIPIGETGTTTRYIYRTLGAADKATVLADTTYYLVGTLSDNSTGVLADTVTDATADDNVSPNWTTASGGTDITPTIGKYCVVNRERLFIAGNSTNPSNLDWSDEFNPDYFPSSDSEPIREDDGDAITAIFNQTGLLRVFKTRTLLNFYTDASSSDDWYASDPISHIGCPAPYSVANTPLGAMYLAYGGIHKFDGQNSVLVSDAVTPDILDILETNYDEVSGVYWKNEYLLAYTSLESGESENNRVLIYDIVRDAYTMDYKNINRWVIFGSGTDFGVLYSGDSTSAGFIYAQEGSAEGFRKRLKSDFESGTFDDARVYGDETDPKIELAWDCDIDGWLTELQTKNASITDIDSIETYLPDAIIDRPDTDGTWVSPGYEVNASVYQELLWNENLGEFGDVTFNVRSASSEAGLTSATFSSAYTDPSGSDISGLTANTWVQFRINLSTTNINFTPTLFVNNGYLFTMTYAKSISTYESAYDSIWIGGWEDFGVQGYEKYLQRIRVYYTGDNGTLTFNFKNEEGDTDTSFDIDLSVVPPYTEPDTGNVYEGVGDYKVYTYYTKDNSEGDAPIGQYWQFKISENGDYNNLWSVSKIEVGYDRVPLD